MTVTERLSVVQCMVYATDTPGCEESTKELLGQQAYVKELNKYPTITKTSTTIPGTCLCMPCEDIVIPI